MHGFVCYAEEKNCKNTCFIAVYLNGSSQNHIRTQIRDIELTSALPSINA
jgi:hypothetical protein